MIQLTKTGRLFLAVSLLLYLASLTSQSGLLLLLIGVLCGCFFVNLLSARRNVLRLGVKVPAISWVAEGEKLSDPWILIHPGGYQPGFVEISSADGPLLRTANLVAGGAARIVPDLSLWRRGVYPLKDLTLSSIYPFGLIRVRRPLPLSGEVIVHPAVYPAPSPAAAGFEVMVGGKQKGGNHSQSGTDFAGIRPAQPGDPLKNIHWRSSAKGHGLMTKTFEEELSGRVSIILDTGDPDDRDVADDTIRAAGSLMLAALEAGHHVDWVDLESRECRSLSPFAGAEEFLDELARLRPASDQVSEDSLTDAWDRIGRRSSVAFVLTRPFDLVAPWIELAQSVRRPVSVYLPRESAWPESWIGPIGRFEFHGNEISAAGEA